MPRPRGRVPTLSPLRIHAVVGAAAALCLTAGGIAWAQVGGHDERGGRPTASLRAPADVVAQPVVPARRAGAAQPEVPTRIVLPDRTVVPIRPAGTSPDGSLRVPHDIGVAGWWRGGALLGDPFGSLLLAAHVDSSTQGLGPFAGLLSVQADQPMVVSSPHLTQTFRVTSLALVPRGELARHPGIFSARGGRRLTLVTCAGPYVPARGGYQNLAVVTARPLQDLVRRSGP